MDIVRVLGKKVTRRLMGILKSPLTALTSVVIVTCSLLSLKTNMIFLSVDLIKHTIFIASSSCQFRSRKKGKQSEACGYSQLLLVGSFESATSAKCSQGRA